MGRMVPRGRQVPPEECDTAEEVNAFYADMEVDIDDYDPRDYL